MSLTTLRMGWRNLGRNRKRTLLAIGAIALGQLTLIFVNSLMAGFFQDIRETITGPMIGHVQIRHPDWGEERAVDLYQDHLSEIRSAIGSLPDVERISPRIFAFALAASGETSTEALRRAMMCGAVIASFGVERFSLERLESITQADLEARMSYLREMARLP